MSVNKIYSWLLIFLLIACKHKKEVIETNNQVLAGVVSSNMTYYDFEPDIVNDTIFELGTTLAVDLDLDGTRDFALVSYFDRDIFGHYFLTSSLILNNTTLNKISILAKDPIYYYYVPPDSGEVQFRGYVKKLRYKDVIDGTWSPMDSLYKGLPLRGNEFYFAVYERNGQNPNEGTANNWKDARNVYMAFRREQGKDTLYGWVRMSVVGYTKIILHDYAIQKP
jgi:hypothetical protein